MEALMIFLIFVAYIIGVITAWFITAWMNDKGKYEQQGFAIALLSWLAVLVIFVMILIKAIDDMPKPTLKK